MSLELIIKNSQWQWWVANDAGRLFQTHGNMYHVSDYLFVSYSSMAECEPSSSSVAESREESLPSSQLDSSIDSVHSSSPSHITHADVEVSQLLTLHIFNFLQTSL